MFIDLNLTVTYYKLRKKSNETDTYLCAKH